MSIRHKIQNQTKIKQNEHQISNSKRSISVFFLTKKEREIDFGFGCIKIKKANYSIHITAILMSSVG